MGATPEATACWARFEAVSGAPSMMLCRMAEKLASGIKFSRHAEGGVEAGSVIEITMK